MEKAAFWSVALLFCALILLIAGHYMKEKELLFEINKRSGKAMIIGYKQKNKEYKNPRSLVGTVKELGLRRHNIASPELNPRADFIGEEISVEYAVYRLLGKKITEIRVPHLIKKEKNEEIRAFNVGAFLFTLCAGIIWLMGFAM